MDMEFKMKMREKRKNVEDEYEFKGRKIGQGSYGIVFKAREKKGSSGEDFALKMIKPYRFTDGELQSVDITTIREIGLLRELKHPNVVLLIKVFFSPEDYNIWLLFDHAEFDLCYIIWQNRKMEDLKMVVPVPDSMVKSVLHQILKGVHFLQTNWVLHRDLKPANILVKGDCSERGRVKVADMGLARLFCSPLKPLTYQEPVVVTCWYRAPELLLGAQHYTKAIELLTYRPIFKCKYQEPKSKNPYHYDQLHRIFQVLGYPHDWEDKKYMSEYKSMQEDFKKPNRYANCKLERYMSRFGITPPSQAFNLLQRMLTMDPKKRITAEEALEDPYFSELPTPTDDVFDGNPIPYPQRAFITESKPEEEEKPIGKQRALIAEPKPEEEEKPIGKKRAFIAEPKPEEEEKPIGKKKKLKEDETDCA